MFKALFAYFAFIAILAVIIMIGWVKNVLWLFDFTGEQTGEFWVSIIGVVMPPLGGLMGYLH